MKTTTLGALAEPNRLRIVELLRDEPLPVGAVAERLGIRQPQVSKHLRVLSEAGLVSVNPQAQQRIYELKPQAFEELDNWLESFRVVWKNRLDSLDRYVQEVKNKEQ